MKVVYQTIYDQMDQKIKEASDNGKVILKFILSKDEMAEYSPLIQIVETKLFYAGVSVEAENKVVTVEPGDKVKIKTWEEMEQEFGLDNFGAINCRFSFTKAMQALCGTYLTVRTVDADGSFYVKCPTYYIFFTDVVAEVIK